MIGLESYDQKEKAKWRRWAWDCIKSMGRKSPFEMRVAYLTGPVDEDRRIAIQRSFLPHNLLAVNYQQDNVNISRKSGSISVCETMERVVLESRGRFDAILFDSCSNADGAFKFLCYLAANHEININTVCVFNIQRGREKRTKCRGHRGEFFASSSLWSAFTAGRLEEMESFLAEKESIAPHEQLELIRRVIQQLQARLQIHRQGHGLNGCKFNSYRSSKVIMDSVAFLWPFVPVDRDSVSPRLKNHSTHRKLAAMEAIRTMRRNAAATN